MPLREHRDALVAALTSAVDACIAQEEAQLADTDVLTGFTPANFRADVTFRYAGPEATVREIKCSPELDLTQDPWEQLRRLAGTVEPVPEALPSEHVA
jgi:hypothetical protein